MLCLLVALKYGYRGDVWEEIIKKTSSCNREKRNLAIETIEVIVIESDDENSLRVYLRDMSIEYLVIKVPAGKIKVMRLLKNTNFYFAKSLIHSTHSLKDIQLISIQQRIDRAISYYWVIKLTI